jgi:integrase
MRLMDGIRLRVKDIDFAYHQIVVRDGKGQKDRIVPLPQRLVEPLRQHLEIVKRLHQADLDQGYGAVYLPHALARKYPQAPKEWGWQYVFPSARLSVDPRSGVIRRHHVHENGLQKAVKNAARQAALAKPVNCHSLRHSSSHSSSFVDNPNLLPPSSLLWPDRRDCPMVATPDLREYRYPTLRWGPDCPPLVDA